MITYPFKTIIAINSENQAQPQSTTLTWEAVSVVTGGLIGISILIGYIVRVTSNFNKIDSKIQALEEGLLRHEKIVAEVELLEKQINNQDKLFGIHLQDFVNAKETTHYLVGGVDEKVKHCRDAGRLELKEAEVEIKELKHKLEDLQQFLHKHSAFAIRESER